MAAPISQLRAVADAASAYRKAFDEGAAFYFAILRQRRTPNQEEEIASQALTVTGEQCRAALWAALDSLAAADADQSTHS